MKQKNLEKLNVLLANWRGANAFLNTYCDDFERLVIAFKQPVPFGDTIGICFNNCVFLSGPTRWSDCDLQCQVIQLPDGGKGVEARDEKGGFVLRFHGAVFAGGAELTFT